MTHCPLPYIIYAYLFVPKVTLTLCIHPYYMYVVCMYIRITYAHGMYVCMYVRTYVHMYAYICAGACTYAQLIPV